MRKKVVPQKTQGSILGTILSNALLNELFIATKEASSTGYVNDNTLYEAFSKFNGIMTSF